MPDAARISDHHLCPKILPGPVPQLLPSLPHWSLREARGHWQVVFTQCQGMAYRLLWGQSLGPFATIESKASSFIFPSFVKRTHDVEGPPDLLATSVLSGSTLCLFRHDVTSWKMHELSENVERAHWIHSDGLDVVVFKRKAWGLANGASEMQGELYVAVLDQNLKMPITYKLPLDPVYDFDVQWVDGSIALFFAGPTSAGLRLLAPDWSIRSLGELDSNGIGQIFQPRLAVCGKQASLAYLERGADLTCLCIASLPLP